MSHDVARLRAATTDATYPKPMLARDRHHGAKYALEWGEDTPNPPLYARGAKYALEWGEDPPKPPSLCQRAKYALEWGGVPPPKPPS